MKEKKLPISVIIPSYKPEAYVYECLDSLRMQTISHDKFEILLILNGCSDPYETDLHKYAERYQKVVNLRIIQTDQSGVSYARNLGVEQSLGEYLAFIDDDDFVSPQYLAELYTLACTGVVPISYIVAFTDGQNEARPYYITDLYEENETKGIRKIMQLRGFMSIVYCKLIEREMIGNRRFSTHFANGEDCLFMAEMSDRIRLLQLAPRSAVYYRRLRENSAVTRHMGIMLRIKKSFALVFAYLYVYLTHPFSYNPVFFATRIYASLRGIVRSYDTFQES